MKANQTSSASHAYSSRGFPSPSKNSRRSVSSLALAEMNLTLPSASKALNPVRRREPSPRLGAPSSNSQSSGLVQVAASETSASTMITEFDVPSLKLEKLRGTIRVVEGRNTLVPVGLPRRATYYTKINGLSLRQVDARRLEHGGHLLDQSHVLRTVPR